ncbi:MAG: glycosyltransferase [Myxococcales bacterium]|nr:glycosyltransferase [Myxococcales bacterium]
MRISVVTPSFNQAAFIERTIESVLGQRGDFELEYLVVDGGSTDGTLEVLRRYEGAVRWLSEKDRGQSDAINKGFRLATGEVLCWLNSDDTLEEGALEAVARELREGEGRWCVGQCRIVDEEDREVRRLVTWYKNFRVRRYSVERLLVENFISQPATFFRRELWEEAGGLDAERWYAMDYDLWLRFGRIAAPRIVPSYLASFRWHGGSKSGARFREGSWEAFQVACRHARPGEQVAVARHFLHHHALVAAYSVMELLGGRGER